MSILDRYILRQLGGVFAFFVLTFTGVVWLGLSLKLVEIVVNNAQSAAVFAELAALLLPRVVVVVLPIAAFAAALHTISRLAGDSEIVVLQACGMSGRRLLRPAALFGAGVMMATLILSLVVTPATQRQLKTRVAEVRGDIAAAFLREGVFESPATGVTVYLRRFGRPGEMLGVFVHDERDPDEAVTYTAERAVLLNDAAGPRLVMFDGVVQILTAAEPDALTLLRFDSLAYDLGQLAERVGIRPPKPSELYLPELLSIGPAQTGGRPVGAYRAEAHEALSGPLYALALPLLAFGLVAGSGFRRRGFLAPVAIAIGIAAALRLAGFGFKAALVGTPALWPLLYLPPLIAAAAGLRLVEGPRAYRRTGGAGGAAWA